MSKESEKINNLISANAFYDSQNKALRKAMDEIITKNEGKSLKLLIAMDALGKMTKSTEEMGNGIYLCSQSCYLIAKEALERINQVGK